MKSSLKRRGWLLTLGVVLASTPLAACEAGPDYPEAHGLTKAEVCIHWRQQRRQAGSNNELAAEIRLAGLVVAPENSDVIEEYIDYAREHC